GVERAHPQRVRVGQRPGQVHTRFCDHDEADIRRKLIMSLQKELLSEICSGRSAPLSFAPAIIPTTTTSGCAPRLTYSNASAVLGARSTVIPRASMASAYFSIEPPGPSSTSSTAFCMAHLYLFLSSRRTLIKSASSSGGVSGLYRTEHWA